MVPKPFDPARYRWREVTDPGSPYRIRHDYTILGHDVAAGTLDMLVRWTADGGHCPIHRHVGTTTILVLDGEQHLWDLGPGGKRLGHRVRRAGDYALTLAEAAPHLESGGATGGLVFFGNHASDGVLYEFYDPELNLVGKVTIAELVADWQANAA